MGYRIPRCHFLLVFLLLFFFHFLFLPLHRTPPRPHPIRPLPNKHISPQLLPTLGTSSPATLPASIIRIRTPIMPPDGTFAIIASHTMRHDFPAPLAIPNTHCVFVIIRFLEVGAEFHERTGRERIKLTRLLEKRRVHEGGEDCVCFLDRDARVRLTLYSLPFVVDLRLSMAPADARELRGFGVLDGHDFARGRVVGVEHVVEQAPDVCDFAGGKGCGELGERVGGFVDEGVDSEFGELVFDGADFKVVVFDFRIDGLEGRD
jgi:hypothetical protein